MIQFRKQIENCEISLQPFLAAVTPFLPHAVVQLQTYFFCDCELRVGWVPYVFFLIVQGKQVMAQRRDCWQDRKMK